ncbi:MAG: hypothetical protein HOA14_17375 [Planctomycetaceae bacterium]|nr:hypothetical protein [Planctomycetaceae bacterium]
MTEPERDSEKDNVIEVFTDFVCPWCYLGEKHLQQAMHDKNTRVQYVYFPLHPETTAGGMTLQQLFAGRGIDVERNQEQLRLMMRNEGLPYGTRTHTYNRRRAQELAKHIEMSDDEAVRSKASNFRAAVFLAYFGEGENIAELEVLGGICERSGLLEFDVEEILCDPKGASAVDADWGHCRQMNVTGVPAYRFRGNWLHGCRGPEALESLIRVERAE